MVTGESLKFLEELIHAPSPSGFEAPAQKVVRAYMQRFAGEVEGDVHGNLMGVLNRDAPMRVMLAGHTDQIGFMVTHVTDDGYVYFDTIGGFDPAAVPGTEVIVHAGSARGVSGVVGRKPIHLLEPKEREKPVRIRDMWIDIGVKSKREALRKVAIGDPITVAPKMVSLAGSRVAASGFDDKAGTFVVAEALRLLSRSKRLRVAVFAVSTVQEELGLRGARTAAFGIDPHAGIAVDVGFASDCPDIDKKQVGDIALGKGPILAKGGNINVVLRDVIVRAARAKKIPLQHQGAPRATGTDANVIQITRAGVAAALVSIPNRYMHTPVEVVDLKDMENAAKLLAAAVESLSPAIDFRP